MILLYVLLGIIIAVAVLFIVGACMGGKRRDKIGIKWAAEQKAKREFIGSQCGHV